ncbi:MFS transporter [Lentzea sp. NPDC042327]|uniref:MFS transporter n=1 Tax=Lentzea sp. NPDC042327 TaxID=3154801 RepID=UPI0033FC5C58
MTTPRTPALTLAIGIVSLEFAAAVATFVSSTLLPAVVRDLDARTSVELLISGATLGLFVALPLATRVLGLTGARGTLAIGVLAYPAGTATAATAMSAWVFAAGQFAAGCASGLLAVFGISAAIQHLDDQWRVRVIAASSAMWVLPALAGPAATLALEHLVGWRWTLLAPVPVVVAGRVLVLRAASGPVDRGADRPLWRTLLVPLGVGVVVFGNRWWLGAAGIAVALAGVASIMPAGTLRARRGAPAALVAMTLFAVGYFGADSLVTILLTDGYGSTMARAAVVLSAAPLAWALTSLTVPRLRRAGREPPPALGLALTAAGVGVLAVGAPVFTTAVVAWTLGGAGVGLAYPGLYLRCTTGARFGATELATAVITAEAFGGLLGRAVGGALVSAGDLVFAYGMFAAFLGLAAVVANRSRA